MGGERTNCPALKPEPKSATERKTPAAVINAKPVAKVMSNRTRATSVASLKNQDLLEYSFKVRR